MQFLARKCPRVCFCGSLCCWWARVRVCTVEQQRQNMDRQRLITDEPHAPLGNNRGAKWQQGPIPRQGVFEASLAVSLIWSTSDKFLKALRRVVEQTLGLSCHEHERWRGRGVGWRHVSTVVRGLYSVGCQIQRMESSWQPVTSSYGQACS
ncbi:hypothetical protein P171DRAFT_48298 [Karstenula rhodostoma CBS 690.94]|uniref:Uncharacterized protein n=1 Tax=Karstenula rhodostoma CBS 690.94 TaxID=1392251 RepID=A0A9P4PF22_9PLEO|nr:hypothetical protein P171DRAFT_48298 [Karstenula rhodostoma CBS 690.94]